MLHLIIDGANVAGSRPDGWWRDREGAAHRLAWELYDVLLLSPSPLAALGGAGDAGVTVHLVLEGVAARAVGLPTDPHLVVVRARADGDASILRCAEELAGQEVVVVTADRELRTRVQAAGAGSVGPRTLLGVLRG